MLCRYERTIFKSDKGFCIFAYSTSDESVPKEARNRSYYHDDKIHFTAIGYQDTELAERINGPLIFLPDTEDCRIL